MSQSVRHSELFASKDWLVLYRAFTTVNFNASDPQSINQALRDYIAANYPEDFNDWIESSEFVAIIDLLAWLAGVLAFKTDINARENFLDSAQARESILRLARFLSYNPRRNRPATGLVKLVEVSTDDDIEDSTGTNLSGVRVQWNNADDPDWFERFTAIMTAAFTGTNPFGTPLKSGTISGTRTFLYRVNCLMGANDFGFNANVGGDSMDFELCNGDFSDLGTFVERAPDINAAFNMFFRNDGNGNSSPRTGFFMLFKQGTLQRESYRIENPIENQLIDISAAGVNETDVWVQTVTSDSSVILNWSKVPAIFSENITYNTLDPDDRNIFSVITRDNDRVSIRFSDGLFGAAPVGNIQVTHRVSNGRQYQVRPTDINRVTQTIKYYNRAGNLRNLRMTFSLQEPVSNATARESDEQIRERAPSTYAAQNRMVSGEDYNTFPLSSNLATKLKAVNRVYSGHSRYVDLNDPTSTYTDVVVTADDGILYRESANLYEEVPLSLNRTASEIVTNHLQPFLRHLNIKTYVNDAILTRVNLNATIPAITITANTTWTQASAAKYSSSGHFSYSNSYFRQGSLLRFTLPNGELKWVGIASVTDEATVAPGAGIRGPVTLTESIPTGSTLVGVLPGFSAELPAALVATLKTRFDEPAERRGFSLWFNPETSEWVMRDDLVSLSTPDDGDDLIHVLTTDYYTDTLWKFAARGSKFVFESARKVKWYHDGARAIDSETGLKRLDTVSILRSNSDLNYSDGRGIGRDHAFQISDLYYYGDGAQEPRRVQLDNLDLDSDGVRDNPTAFHDITDATAPQSTLFWRLGESFGSPAYLPCHVVNVFTQAATTIADVPNRIRIHSDPENGSKDIAFTSGDVVYMEAMDEFFLRVNSTWQVEPRRNYRVATGRGPNTALRWMVPHATPGSDNPKFVTMYSRNANEVAMQGLPTSVYQIRNGAITFVWKHYAPVNHRIDPSLTNVIDMFVLSSEYDFAIRLWIANGAKMADLPVPPTELDLRLTFAEYSAFKMFSDEVVWRPVQYKFLFGNGSEEQNLRARFKVVKLQNTNVADGEIKTRVISAVNEFFNVSRWDFGETFYYTELAAYIHQQLAGVIGSVVVVPMDEEASFGDVFEVRSRSDEVFISTAQVTDVEIINSNTSANLRIR